MNDLLKELKAAHKIIMNAMCVMTTEQKKKWAEENAVDGVDGEGITRAKEREAVIAAAQAGDLPQDVEILLTMLGNREYTEHWAKTALGQRLESAMTKIHGELSFAQRSGQDREEQPGIFNPLTTYGMLIRALRVVAGTSLMEMSKDTGYTPAFLSSVEFGRSPVTQAIILITWAFFLDKKIDVPITLLAKAATIEAQKGAV